MAWTVPSGCYYAGRRNAIWTYYDQNTTVSAAHDPTIAYITLVLVDFANGYIYSNATNITIELTNNNTFVIPDSQVGMISPLQFYASIDCINSRKHIALDGAFSFGDGSGIMDASDFLQPNKTYDMTNAFYKRTDIVSVSIPDGVGSLIGTFNGCTSLASVSQIPNTADSLIGTFAGCTSLTTAPNIPNGVRNVTRCFKDCSSLVTASTIPASVVSAESCFENCTSLTGSITIDASPTNITNMFTGTVQDIVLFGTGGLNETLVSEYANLYFWSLSATITAQREEQTQTTIDISVNVSRFSSGTLSSLNLYRDSDTTPLSVTWNDTTLTITGTSATFTTTLTSIGESDTFTLTVVATDSYGSSQASSVKIPISFYTMDVQAGGKEIAFGGLADDDVTDYPEGLFECNMSFKLKDNLFWIGTRSEYEQAVSDDKMPEHTIVFITDETADYVVEEGTSGIWTYRKWNSGIAECWGVTPLTNGGVKEKVHAVALPFTFANTSYIVTQAISDVGAGYQYANSNFSVHARYTTEVQLNIKCDTNGTNITYNCYLSIHGKWK